ncbi:syntaxin 6 [Strigomonas culicis]|uniref:Syntaxin 6 n=1 Tax=Strigomonas culicis TaxID=28005 RepID=S9UG18_9TRYP|nr:syntaxin 6 [Strigomonas culicis]EPY31101.1 syntaxin 6 [Strigomonas culicis]EPY33071.1 syntaxin 6 [Strigomonas culicis]|eukprot:EPY27873.1 syntaxin 6 [Strigomonas culicis]
MQPPTAPLRGQREDPYPQMERQVQTMLSDLTLQLQRFRDTANPTLIAENELLESIGGCTEAVEDMRFALDTAMDHPESFSITTEELQARAERIRAWERDMQRAQQTAEKVRAAQRRRAQAQNDANNADPSQRENDEFLKQEFANQKTIQQTDDQTLDRLSSGIHRLHETAVNINEEMTTQEHIINDIDRGMSRVQSRLDGAMKKVGMLIDKTSDTGKMICIGVLFIILILCIVFVVR